LAKEGGLNRRTQSDYIQLGFIPMVQTDESTISYAGNSSIVTPYSVPFYFFTNGDLIVVVKDATSIEDLQILDTDYVVNGEGDFNGGNVVMKWAVPATSTVTIYRDVDPTQLTSYQEADAFPAKSHERALDKLTMLVQQALRLTGSGGPTDLGRAFRLSEASVGINAVAKVNDSTLGVDAMGNAVLRSASEMLGWMGQYGTAWENTSERLQTSAAYTGQVGVQIDNLTIYIARSMTPGDWLPFLIGTGIVAATNGVPHLMTPPAGDLVGTDESQTLYNKTLESPAIHTPTGLTKNDVGLSQCDNTSDLNKPLSSATGAALAFKQDKNEKGISNGYPSLDGSGKIPTVQLPDSVVGASQYQGTWDAATNTPTIPAAALGNKGWYYSVSVAGTTSIDGINSWAVGDQIISNGTVWQKIVNVSAVSSVNSKTGAVVLVKADIGLSNVDNLSQAQLNAASVTLTNHTIDGANNTLNVRLGTNDVSGNLPVNRLNAGTGADGTTFWRGDGTWGRPTGTGDVLGPNGAGDGEIAIYSGTTGKIIDRYSGPAGFAKLSATGFTTTTAKIHGADLDPDVISAQPVKTAATYQDSYLLYDFATGLLKSTPAASVSRLPRNYLSGCIISNNVSDTANDIDIAPGECRDDTNSADIVIPSTLTKRLDAVWAAGTGAGGRDTGAITDATWHLFAIRNPTTNVCDVLFSQSLGAPTMPSGFTQKRRIGSMVRLAAPYGGLQPIRQLGDYFQINAPLRNESLTTATGGINPITLTSIPYGLKWYVDARINLTNSAGVSQTRLTDPDQPDSNSIVLATSSTANQTVACAVSLWCTAGRIVNWAIPYNPSVGTCTLGLYVAGWWDTRGTDR
jgi:hypothetical protein